MRKPNSLILKLDGTSPDKLPMNRLTKYLSALTDLYGSADSVHFDKVSEGSACLNTWVDNDATYKDVISRSLSSVQNNGKSYQRLVELLSEDGFNGSILNAKDDVIVIFPKVSKEVPLYVRKKTTVQGRLYSVGGKDDSIPVKVEGANGETYHCEATPALASELGAILFQIIRVNGEGDWERKGDAWKLKKLKISSYEKVKKVSLKEAVKVIRSASGNQWAEEDDPHALMQTLRKLNCE
ncbi:hypothetical protein [Pantoea piersonii]|nr:hypothetical protein [Pantoea piersonii]